MINGENVLLGVSAGIAAYKSAYLARLLKKAGCNVHVIMTPNAVNFITPLTFESLTGNKCVVDTFDRNFQFNVEHVALAKLADAVIIAPASADVVGKLACGIADDMLTTTVMACKCKKIIAPAMNHNMYHNPIVQDNLAKLEKYGFSVIPPERGMLANGDMGDGRMPSEQTLFQWVERELSEPKDLSGLRVLVTAGATQESIDPVRFITNHSTGKMGVAVAYAAMLRGAQVTLVKGHTEVDDPPFVKTITAVSAADMFSAVVSCAEDADIIIKAAAVADYRPVQAADHKLKKGDNDMTIQLARTRDILAYLGEHKHKGQILCGFSMETENLVENSRGKLKRKNLDIIAANSLKTEGAGFGTDTNVLTIITPNKVKELEKMSKTDAANALLDEIITLKNGE
ncbi:MAG: bifunctional phosphopantothenoylcysteine decarboxylase/phosphopantothenate--cysteine ligase CoaBC [Oscillospiraceae bacterium]|nr:bifunctional phosphopantothenoylcysteine decarboxylase/phosphopantothenate--cysteine ligase CoaBC [Oscillospiraceae bacterium]